MKKPNDPKRNIVVCAKRYSHKKPTNMGGGGKGWKPQTTFENAKKSATKRRNDKEKKESGRNGRPTALQGRKNGGTGP